MRPAGHARVLRDPVRLLGTGFGIGLVPFAPGTAASVLALLPAWLLAQAPWSFRIGIIALAFVLGIWICGESARRFGVDDHPAIVWDEIVGLLATALAVGASAAALLGAFLAFRLFDIWKPWPIRDVDHRLGGGLGIMLDDVLAAAYAAALLRLIEMIVPLS
jgi:phosphatidylglycerophosphatase A